MKKIKTVGFFVNTTKENSAGVVEGVSAWLQERGIVPLLPEEQAIDLGYPRTDISKTEVVEQADMLLVLGGDGTLLSAAHTPQIENVPAQESEYPVDPLGVAMINPSALYGIKSSPSTYASNSMSCV